MVENLEHERLGTGNIEHPASRAVLNQCKEIKSNTEYGNEKRQLPSWKKTWSFKDWYPEKGGVGKSRIAWIDNVKIWSVLGGSRLTSLDSTAPECHQLIASKGWLNARQGILYACVSLILVCLYCFSYFLYLLAFRLCRGGLFYPAFICLSVSLSQWLKWGGRGAQPPCSDLSPPLPAIVWAPWLNL